MSRVQFPVVAFSNPARMSIIIIMLCWQIEHVDNMLYTGSTQNYEKESSSSPISIWSCLPEIIQKLIKLRNACQLNTIRYTCNSCTEISDLHEVAERYSVLRRVRKDGRELPETKHVFFSVSTEFVNFFFAILKTIKNQPGHWSKAAELMCLGTPCFLFEKICHQSLRIWNV